MTEVTNEISEYNEAGNLTATYIQSKSISKLISKSESNPSNQPSSCSPATTTVWRTDIIVPKDSKSLLQRLLDVFLPAGYPHSVTEDYLLYQIYDSLQAFSSSIASLLAARAVLEGVGIGDASASPTAALLLSVLQESAGRIATILFAHKLGSSLEPECKMYRLAADVLNDAAMILDCLSPAFPKPVRVLVLSFSSCLRALCGVAAGSSKASLSAHFAKCGNLGELNAKDSSQETVISLMGMLVGSVVVTWVTTPFATWTSMLFLLTIHLFMNHAAVRAVSMRSLNRQRANILLSQLLENGRILSPQQVSKRERIFERDGVLRWSDDSVLGYCWIGVNLETLLHALGRSNAITGSLAAKELDHLLEMYNHEQYVLHFDPAASIGHITLKRGSSPESHLKAWCHALLLSKEASKQSAWSTATDDSVIAETLKRSGKLLDEFGQRLEEQGWDLSIAALETHSGSRIECAQGNESVSPAQGLMTSESKRLLFDGVQAAKR